MCNSPNSHNLKQIKIYDYQNSLLKKTQNYSYHWHFRSMTSPLYPVHVFLLVFPHIFSVCLLQQLGRKHYQFHFLQKGLSELVNGWFKNSFVKSLNCFLPLFMIAKKCFHKSLVLLKSRHEQLQNVSLSPKETLYLNCHLYQDHRSKLQKIHLFALLQNQSSGWTLFELFPIEMWLMIVVYFVNMKDNLIIDASLNNQRGKEYLVVRYVRLAKVKLERIVCIISAFRLTDTQTSSWFLLIHMALYRILLDHHLDHFVLHCDSLFRALFCLVWYFLLWF